MEAMLIELPTEMLDFVDEKVKEGAFPSRNAYFQDLIAREKLRRERKLSLDAQRDTECLP